MIPTKIESCICLLTATGALSKSPVRSLDLTSCSAPSAKPWNGIVSASLSSGTEKFSTCITCPTARKRAYCCPNESFPVFRMLLLAARFPRCLLRNLFSGLLLRQNRWFPSSKRQNGRLGLASCLFQYIAKDGQAAGPHLSRDKQLFPAAKGCLRPIGTENL